MRKIQCEECPGRGVVCDLPPDALADFRAAGATTVYRPHQVVFAEGHPAAGLHVVCSGGVKLYHADRFGREHVVDMVFPGSVIGAVGVDASEHLSVSAETIAESQLSFISNEKLPAFLRKHPEAGVRMLAAVSQALGRAQQKVRDLALKGAESRLASLLLQLAASREQPLRDGVRLSFKRRDLADMTGISTETAIRLLGKMRAKGAVETEGRDILLCDLARLRQIAHYDEQDA